MRSTVAGTIFLLLLLGTVGIPSICSGETEPNDSLDLAEILGEEWTYGRVSLDHDDRDETDMDFYRVDLPPRNIAVITLKKVDTDPYWGIYLESFNQYKELDYILWRMNGRRSYYYDDNEMDVDVPGSEVRGFVVGSDDETVFYLKVFGSGNYSIKRTLIPSPDPKDGPFDVITQYLDQGSSIENVYEIRYESIHIYDIDQFRTHTNMSNYMFRLEKLDTGDGQIFLAIYKYDQVPEIDEASPITVLAVNSSIYELAILYDSYENVRNYHGSNYWYHDGNDNYFFNIWGEGQYRITVDPFPLLKDEDEEDEEEETDDDKDDESSGLDDPIQVLGCMVLNILVFMIIVGSILLVIFLVTRKERKKEELPEKPGDKGLPEIEGEDRGPGEKDVRVPEPDRSSNGSSEKEVDNRSEGESPRETSIH
ncbi:MAG: hypothetical protein ACMUHY_03920, partial [Thermoplasmatota archaeon]